jgi:hypothetical protein
MQELWRPVVGYEGLYEVSDLGNVRAPAKWTVGKAGSSYLRPARGLSKAKHRYWSVCLYKNGRKRTHAVHCLVLEAFVGGRPKGHVACHGPAGVDDNSVQNLRWDTQVSNLADRHRDGTMLRGSTHGMALLTEVDVLQIRQRLDAGEVQRKVAAEYCVTPSLIWRIHKKLLWKHV